jgi:hypothetical protein
VVPQDEERMKKALNEVPSHAELNAMLARTEEERQLWDKMDAEHEWPGPSISLAQAPDWVRYGEADLGEAMRLNTKLKPKQVGAVCRRGLGARLWYWIPLLAALLRKRGAALMGQRQWSSLDVKPAAC